MRLGILADIHGNLLALEAILADLERRQLNHVVNLGDCVSGPLWPRETAELLTKLQWSTVRGNHDRWVTNLPSDKHSPSDAYAFRALDAPMLEWLHALPPVCELNGAIFACHGRPDDDNAYLLENVTEGRLVPAPPKEIAERVRTISSQFVLCAHSHLPGAATVGDITIINPGSVGMPAYEDPFPPAHVSESGTPFARYAILQLDGGNLSFEHIAIPYDHDAAARRAEENENLAWAHFLRTGYARNQTIRFERPAELRSQPQ